MTVHVLLTDRDDATLLVACPDTETAEKVACAAVWSDGGVSAWLVPDHALTASASVIDALHAGASISDLHEHLTGRDFHDIEVTAA